MARDLQREHDELELMRQRREVMFWTLRQWVALAALVVAIGLLTLDYFQIGRGHARARAAERGRLLERKGRRSQARAF